jgi:hypothetical protein
MAFLVASVVETAAGDEGCCVGEGEVFDGVSTGCEVIVTGVFLLRFAGVLGAADTPMLKTKRLNKIDPFKNKKLTPSQHLFYKAEGVSLKRKSVN